MSAIKTVYLPNPRNTEFPEVRIDLYYWTRRGYTVIATDVKRSTERGWASESSQPLDARRYKAVECNRPSKTREAAALDVFDKVVAIETAKIPTAPISQAAADHIRPEWDAMQKFLSETAPA